MTIASRLVVLVNCLGVWVIAVCQGVRDLGVIAPNVGVDPRTAWLHLYKQPRSVRVSGRPDRLPTHLAAPRPVLT